MGSNYLVVYDTATGRVAHWEENSAVVPVLPDYYPSFDALTQNYHVGVGTLDDAYWSEDGTLNAAGIALLGLPAEEVSKYVRNLVIARSNTDYLFSEETLLLTYQPAPLIGRPTYLTVETLPGDPLVTAGGGPNGEDAVPTNRYDYQNSELEAAIRWGYSLTLRVIRRWNDGTIHTGATDTITMVTNNGAVTETSKALTGGIAEFTWIPGPDSGLVMFSASSSVTGVIVGSLQLWIDSLADVLGDALQHVKYNAQFSIFMPGVVNPSMGVSGVVARLYLPTEPQPGSGFAYKYVYIKRAQVNALTAPVGADLVLRITGLTSGTTQDITLKDGEHWTLAGEDYLPLPADYFAPGEYLECSVSSGTAGDVTLHIQFKI